MMGVDQPAAAAACAHTEGGASPREKSRDALFAGISHDLRSPVFSISMALDLIERLGAGATADARVQRALATIRRSTARLLEIANDISDLASLEGGRLALTRGPVDAGALVRELCDAYAGAAAERSLTLACAVDPSLPPADWDGARMRRALACFISSALNATCSPGAVSIEVRRAGTRLVIRAGAFEPTREISAATPAATGPAAEPSAPLRVAAGVVVAHGGSVEMGVPGAFVLSLPLQPAAGASA